MKKFISLFSGAGGLDLGFLKDGWTPLLFTDNWEPAVSTLIKNHPKVPVINEDIRKISDDFFSKYKDIDIIIGGPPCQTFSRLNQNQLFEDGKETEVNLKDPRRSLFMEFIRAVSIIQPKAVLIENVADLATRKLGGNNKDKNVLIKHIIIQEMEKIGYHVGCFVINSKDYNVPQKRKRIFFIGLRKDLNIIPTQPKLIKLKTSVINELNKIKNDDPNQKKKNHSNEWINRAKLIPKGGYYNDLPIHLKKLTQVSLDDATNNNGTIKKGFCARIENTGEFYLDSIYSFPYGTNFILYKIMPRMGTYFRRIRDDVSHTITRNPLIHPNKNREMTVREKACIQTFPTNYEFCGSISDQHILVGNAVPVNLGFEFAKYISEILKLGD